MKTYSIRRAPSGDLQWSLANTLSDFAFPWQPGVAPLTEFRALHDDTSFHFRFDCVDLDLVLGEGDAVKDRVIGSDRVELFVTPDLGLDPYYCLELDPRGEVLAYRCRTYRQFDWSWRCEGLAVTAGIDIESHRYWVQAQLPLATLQALGVLKSGSRELYAGVYRAEFSHRPDGSIHFGWLPWVDPRTEKPDFHVPESFGRFELD